MLANISVVVILLVPGEFLLSRIRYDVKRISDVATGAQETAALAKETAEKTERSLEDVRVTLLNRQQSELDAELDVYRNMVADPSRESLIEAIRHAAELDLIVPEGVRSPVWETDLHYRFVLDPSYTKIEVRLEQDNGEVISSHPWSEDTPADDFYQELVEAVRAAGHDLGTLLNDPTQSVEELSNMLVDVTRLRSQELAGHRKTHCQIIERHHGWYFTKDNVVGGPHNDYVIKVTRLNELDWEEHLSNKGWYEGPSVITFARSLYGLAPRTITAAEKK